MKIVKKAKIKQNVMHGDPLWVGTLMLGLIPFDSQGAMRARRFDGDSVYMGAWGRMPVEYQDSMAPIYMVWSYETPIGWVTDRGEVVVPDVKYGPTTTHHQNLTSVYMGQGACPHAPGLPDDRDNGYIMAECGAWVCIGGDWL